MTRAEKVAEAQQLRGEGLKLREIAERMGAAVQTVNTWLSDPDLSKQRARRESYRGVCVDCGAPTSGSNGRERAAKRCARCDRAVNPERTRERWRPRRALVEGLWAEGKTSAEIEAIVGWRGQRGRYIPKMRSVGYDLPHRYSPERVANMTRASGPNLVKARAVKAERRRAAA